MKVYIFGTGEGKDILYKCRKLAFPVEGYVDNNEQLWNQKVDGISVIAPTEIDASADYIIISVMFYYEIYGQLLELGIERQKILPFFSRNVIKNPFFRKYFDYRKWNHAVISCHGRRFRNNWKQVCIPVWRNQYKAFCRFKRDQGDVWLRYKYDLNPNSVVFDLGGYQGDFTWKIVSMYDCYVYVFEPVREYAQKISERFKDNKKVKVFAFGLEDKDSREILYLDNDGSSVYGKRNNKNGMEIEYRCASEFLRSNNVKHIDLMKINIEGGEYALLEHLLKTGKIQLIENLQIQFHYIRKIKSEKRRKQICRKLMNSHELTWAYRPYIFENWKRRK